MEYNKFKDMLLQKAMNKGFEECEIYYSEGESLSIGVYEGEVEKYSLEKSKGVSFRGKIGSKMGYSYTEILDLEAIDMLIKNAKEAIKYIESNDEEYIYEGDEEYNLVNTYNEKLSDIPPKKLIDLVLQLEKETKNYSDKVVNLQNCKLTYNNVVKRINNTKNVDLIQKHNQLISYVTPVVEENGVKENSTGYIITRDINKLDTKKIAKESVESALEKLNASTMKSGKYKTIIHNEAMADLLETFAQVFNSDIAQKKMSLLEDKEGQIIGSSCLTIIDNPLLEEGIASTSFDDEGVKTYKKEVISNGKLNTLLYNLKTAKKANKKSTGNGFKGTYKSSVRVQSSNLYIQEGTHSLKDLMEDINEGVVITELAGLHSGANAISGDFSLAAKGFYVKDGTKSYPVEQITIAGNFFELLKDIEKVGNDTVFPLSSVGSPSVIVKQLNITGK